MRSFVENDHCSYRFHEGILHIIYHQGVSVDLKAALQIVRDRLLLHQGQLLPVLCDIRGIKDINIAARAYLVAEGFALLKAIAFLVQPPKSKLVFEFYIRTNIPPIPTQSFENKEEALAFLREFIA
tara:strand:+ start:15067 stop:15444 length:378 start_codon:yes stop_codon:yes gene_type:complete